MMAVVVKRIKFPMLAATVIAILESLVVCRTPAPLLSYTNPAIKFYVHGSKNIKAYCYCSFCKGSILENPHSASSVLPPCNAQ